MRILFTNIALNARTGTEILTRELAVAMRRRGHECVIYTHAKGAIADWLADRGFEVTDSIASIAGPIDVIHGHHSSVAGIAAMRFPDVPAIFVCHDLDAWHDAPPKLPNFKRFVAIGPTSAQRLTRAGWVSPDRISIIPNGVDQDRFRAGPPLPEKCGRALAFCKSPEMVKPIRDACRQGGIAVEFAGYGTGNPIDDPSMAMPKYDLVFCSGLTAREALSCGRAVVCCDNRGLGGMISVQRLKDWGNNLGQKILTQALNTENFAREIDRYDSADAAKAAELFAAGCSITDCAERYESVYRLAIAEGGASQRVAASPDVLEFIEAYCQKPGNPRVAAPERCVRQAGDAKRPLIDWLRWAFQGV